MASAAVDQHADTIGAASRASWAPGLTRVPYWLYQDPAIQHAEQQRIFQGPAWHYLCLEADIPDHGDYRTSCIGEMPVIAVRGEGGAIQGKPSALYLAVFWSAAFWSAAPAVCFRARALLDCA